MQSDIINELAKAYNTKGDMVRSSGRGDSSGGIFFRIMADYYESILTAKTRGTPLAWSGLFIPIEILYAMDIIPFMVEQSVTAFVYEKGTAGEFSDAAAGMGISQELCSLHRNLIGMGLNKAAPPPDIIVSTSQTCDVTLKSYEALGHYFSCPTYFLDFPYWETKEAISYYGKEIENLILFLEEHTGKTFNEARLLEVLELSKQADDLFYKICELRKNEPSPIGMREAVAHFGVRQVLSGTQQAVEYFRSVLEEGISRVNANKGPTNNERIRLLWLYVPIYFELRLYRWLEKKFGAVVVMDTMSYVSEERMNLSMPPLECLTRKAYNQFITAQYCRPMDKFLADIFKTVAEFKADACIYLAHIGCKHGCASIRMLRDAIEEECEIPFFTLDADSFDPTVVSSREIKQKLTGFMEMMEDEF
ncbi:MAG: 2-hydroxyacyl-CoA dehydratase [bacterium]|nr:2-hydroxyacyl-CoA dehydratase [bacterium]